MRNQHRARKHGIAESYGGGGKWISAVLGGGGTLMHDITDNTVEIKIK